MASAKNTGTGSAPLVFARELSALVNAAWDFGNGKMLQQVTPVTADLLNFWFSPTFTETRAVNFHTGQRQAILNTIYAHEVLKTKNLFDLYSAVSPDTLADLGLDFGNEIGADKYQYPKYCMKMATGTGKTWVMHALVIWQYLNAKYDETDSGAYSSNFLLVAPGLIVYERLLDAYLGKETSDGTRDFDTSDFSVFRDLFTPESYRNTVFSFIQNSVARKDEIARKITGDGLIAITNWHLLMGHDESDAGDDGITTGADSFADTKSIVKDLLPITPGITAGHSLESLDNKYFHGTELEYLASFPDIVVINDEAHHIHENKTGGVSGEVEWQKSLDKIAANKGGRFTQIDFSATPYNVTGSGQKRTRHYFPHIIVDFDLKQAIHAGLVKTIVLDKRKEIASQELAKLDFRAERDERGEPVGLSEGQKIMLRAGITKLRILEEQFVSLTKNDTALKYPKMLVVCEDTKVSPLVVDHLVRFEGFTADEVTRIDSGQKDFLSEDEWKTAKRALFNIDNAAKPKVIVSVLMLREGFDVNNICVIVPLRSGQAPILLEQTVGRGLRLMWRGSDYEDIKAENRQRLLVEKKAPANYLDILSIVEHPAFNEFYEELSQETPIGEAGDIGSSRESVLGDIIEIPLKEGYEKYDLFFPLIVREREEILRESDINIDTLAPFTIYRLDQLKQFAKSVGGIIISEELTVGTRFGTYKVSENVFNANSYNEFLSGIVTALSASIEKMGGHVKETFPFMQINGAKLTGAIDAYIRTRLFEAPFDPFEDENWRVLVFLDKDEDKTCVSRHIIMEISKVLYAMQNDIEVREAQVYKHWFSSVGPLKARENFCVPVAKSIYPFLPYPSNKGQFEKDFMRFLDSDSEVSRFIKIKESNDFAYIHYMRGDGMISRYYPDFIAQAGDDMYLIETKAERDVDNANVRAKKRSALDWTANINELPPAERENCIWHYCLVNDALFYQWRQNGASVRDILNFAKIQKADTMEQGEMF